jgi:hypothetical protein
MTIPQQGITKVLLHCPNFLWLAEPAEAMRILVELPERGLNLSERGSQLAKSRVLCARSGDESGAPVEGPPYGGQGE